MCKTTAVDLKGLVFGTLTVKRRHYPHQDEVKHCRLARWVCECSVCGRKRVLFSQAIRGKDFSTCRCANARIFVS
jgi:hypothetical protein